MICCKRISFSMPSWASLVALRLVWISFLFACYSYAPVFQKKGYYQSGVVTCGDSNTEMTSDIGSRSGADCLSLFPASLQKRHTFLWNDSPMAAAPHKITFTNGRQELSQGHDAESPTYLVHPTQTYNLFQQ